MKSPTPLLVGCAAALLFGGIFCDKIFPASRATAPKHHSQRRATPPARPAPARGAPPATAPEPGDPDDALSRRDEGYQQIAALQASGDFQRAAEFATAEAAEFGRDWIIAAYFSWGKNKPEAAAAHALTLTEPAARQLALQSAFSGWAHADPQGLAEIAFDRPDGPEKNAALTKAIREWVHRDPEKAGDWIAAHTESIPVVEKMFRDDRR